jgi:rubrerythrin
MHGSNEGVMSVAAIVHDADKLRELDDGERQAWQTYSRRLRNLTGEEYERVESESWAELQRQLRQLERRRRTLTGNST